MADFASSRVDLAKALKDIEQAAALSDAFFSTGDRFYLKSAIEEAAERGAPDNRAPPQAPPLGLDPARMFFPE